MSLVLIGSAALAQQGLVVEPWRQVSPPVAVAVPPKAMPGSGLPPAHAAFPPPRKSEAVVTAPAVAKVEKWSPPVVELLVDPWTKADAAVVPHPQWAPQPAEIIDPWANAAAPEPPRVASRPAEHPQSTIF